ncbi:MAG: rod shape-determining protein MreC [Phycisphaerales bacterium]|nr:MAG: rod shape-determining protein MreC [Phycisphaerales bacterium]
MRSRRDHDFSRRRALLIGMALVAIGAILLPQSWTDGLVSLVQILVPFQHSATVAAEAVSGVAESDGAPVDARTFQALQRENAALEHENASLALRVSELEEEVSLLTATRLWGGEEHRLGASGRLIPARVVAPDILAWRSSRLINAGSLQGVRDGAAVVSQSFSIDRGTESGVQTGMAILLAETLVGEIEQVGTHTSRVKLLSDVSVEMKVRIGRFGEDGFVALDRFYWLTGCGSGVMEICEVNRRDVEAGVVQVGDVVLSDHTSGTVPAPMTVGKIVAIEPNREKPLLSTLEVRSPLDIRSLNQVYVFDPGAGDGE